MYNYRENIPDTAKLFNVSRESHHHTNWEGYSLTQSTNEALIS